MTPQEKAQAALEAIRTYLKLGDSLRDAVTAALKDADADTTSELNGMLHAMRAQYQSTLTRHDWDFEMSDDHRGAYEKGRQQRMTLNDLQPLVDPFRDLWNSVAPEAYRVRVAS